MRFRCVTYSEISVLVASSLFFACGHKTEFAGVAATPTPVKAMAANAEIESHPTNLAIDISCQQKIVTVPSAERTKANKINFRFADVCSDVVQIHTPDSRAIDIVFALDVTGSMRSALNTVREGVSSLMRLVQERGWQVRAGSLAFADDILEEIPLSSHLDGLLARMTSADESGPWAALPGFGGDEPEQGLWAVERAVALLKSADDAEAVPEKLIVYVSDAPARNQAGSFDVGPTARLLSNFSEEVAKKGGALSFLYSSSSARTRLTDSMPTPAVQMVDLSRAAKVNHAALPFPLTSKGLQTDFLDVLAHGALRTDECRLKEVFLERSSPQEQGSRVVPVHADGGTFSFSARQLEKGMRLVVKRECHFAKDQASILTIEL